MCMKLSFRVPSVCLHLPIVGLLALTGCATQPPIAGAEVRSPLQQRADQGIALLAAGQAKQASAQFNQALARAPADANLHFLNGLSYRQLGYENGQDASELAETGYRLALEFDADHWLAAWHLGLLQVEQRHYAEARQTLAKAARLRPRNPDIQLALAGAAYQARDVPVALWAAENTLALRADDPEALRIAALSTAALGLDTEAREFSGRYRQLRPAESEVLDDRVGAWGKAHAQPIVVAQSAPSDQPSPGGAPSAQIYPDPASASGLQTQSPSDPSARSGNPTGAPAQGAMALNWSDCPQSAGQGGGGWGSSGDNVGSSGDKVGSSGDKVERLAALPSPCNGRPLPRMVVVDVSLIRTTETTNVNQGVNVLQGLGVVLSGSWAKTRTAGDQGATSNTTITRNIALPSSGIPYSLNIFNTGDSAADVIARPSLLALDRNPSTFFSGSILSIALSGQYGGNVVDKNIGISLSVTPTFIDDDRVLLAVKGSRSFVEPELVPGLNTSAINSTSNIVFANVIMRFGETLILSGLREREYTKTKEGVPVLRDVPLLQYLFSTRTDSDYAKHILIMITPRKPADFAETDRAAWAYARSPDFGAIDDIGAEALGMLRSRRPNIEAALARLQRSHYGYEFRSGDVSARRFAPYPSLERVLEDIRRMLYF